MKIALTKFYGLFLAILALVGIISSGSLFGLMNTDVAMDIFRIVLAAGLLYVGYWVHGEISARRSLLTLGIVFVVLAIVGIGNSTLWGIVPTGLTEFDILFHLVAGALATSVAVMTETRLPSLRY